eukprot:2315153-Rhodomonas_salina.1
MTVGPTALEEPSSFPHWLTPSTGYDIDPDRNQLVFLDAVPEAEHAAVLEQLEECSSWIVLERVRKRGTTTVWLHDNCIPADVLTADHHKVYHKLWRYWRKKHNPAPRSPPEPHSDLNLGGAAAELPFSYNAGQFAFNHGVNGQVAKRHGGGHGPEGRLRQIQH